MTPRELLEEEYMQDNSETEAPIEPNAPEMGQLKRQSEENGQDFQPEAAESGGFVSAPIYASVSGTVKAIETRLSTRSST